MERERKREEGGKKNKIKKGGVDKGKKKKKKGRKYKGCRSQKVHHLRMCQQQVEQKEGGRRKQKS